MVLIAYDGSDTAKKALAHAHELLGDVAATVIYVWEPPVGLFVPDPFSGVGGWSPAQISDLEAVVRERAGRLLAEGVSLATDAGFDATGRLEESQGSPWRSLLDVADELDASLLVLGTHGVSGVRAVLGSVSTAVAHHTTRPLLLIPADALS